MKKAQILSAIALAFALGVVAPVAGANAAPQTRSGSLTPAETTKADVEGAIAKAKTADNYSKYVALYDAVKATTKDGADVTLPASTTITGAITAINDKYTPAADITLSGAIAAANNTNVPNYTKWEKIISLMTKDNSVAENTQRDNLITAVQAVFPTYNAGDDATYASVVSDITTDVATIKADYDNYSALISAVSNAVAAQKVENGLRGALANIGKSAAEIEAETTITGLKSLATGYPKYGVYKALIDAVDEAQKDVNNNTTADFANDVTTLGTTFEAATGKKLADVTAPVPPENPDEPGTDEPGTDDPSAPGTGIVSSAEGNAATTVSIVAGLATALTALGAGVVAYRSARRSNK